MTEPLRAVFVGLTGALAGIPLEAWAVIGGMALFLIVSKIRQKIRSGE